MAETTEAPREPAWGHKAWAGQEESQLCQKLKVGPPFSVGGPCPLETLRMVTDRQGSQ